MKVESRSSLKTKYNLYKITLVSFVTIIIWIGSEIYWSYNKPKPTKILQQQIQPLNPNLDTQLINTLENRISISTDQLSSLEENLVFKEEEQEEPATRRSTDSLLDLALPATQSGQQIQELPESTQSAILQ